MREAVEMKLDGKVALVTGAGSGIGRAAAMKLAAAGATVGVLSRTESEVEEIVREIRTSGGEAIGLAADVSDAVALEQSVAHLAERAGRLDIVFANAGINGVWAPIDELRPADWDQTVTINLTGTYLTLHFTVPHLKAAGGGAIVITSSINGTRTFSSAGATAYSCTKAAQLAMAKMTALELAPHGIRVNVICPGRIDTEIQDNTQAEAAERAEVPAEFPEGDIPLTGGAAGRSADVADLVLFLASDRARHITGTPVWIDGGQSLLVG